MYKGSVSAIRTNIPDYGKTALLTAPSSPVKQAVIVHQSDLANNSGSSAAMGWGYKLIDSKWSLGQWDVSEAPEFVDDTTDAQDAGTGDVALFTTTNDDGFVVSASEVFNLVGLTISTAEVGSPAYVYEYWNGTAWDTLSLLQTPDYTATGDTAIAFANPADWAKGGDTGEGINADHYAIRVTASTAPSTAPLATIAWVVRLLDYVGVVTTGSTLNRIQYVNSNGSRVPTGHALVAYSSVVSASNIAYFEYSQV